ncbi:hypothetical protein BDD12DRAFT_19586 [Trichophaea hybrida]|nr:hypothetical protein BDD12DRAFT_19586 [Trichophaea hybrida]
MYEMYGGRGRLLHVNLGVFLLWRIYGYGTFMGEPEEVANGMGMALRGLSTYFICIIMFVWDFKVGVVWYFKLKSMGIGKQGKYTQV